MKLTSTTKRVAVGLLAAALPLSMAACSKGASSSTGGAGGELTMWTHNAGNKAELAAIRTIVTDYNASQTKYKVEVQAFPQDSYNQSVVAAAASKKLPCILDIDGPNVPNWAWAGYLAPLDGHGRDAVEVPAARCSASGTTRPTPSATTTSRSTMVTPQVDPARSTASASRPIDQPWTNGRVHRGAEEDPRPRATSRTRSTSRPATPASGGPTPTPRSCRASAAT